MLKIRIRKAISKIIPEIGRVKKIMKLHLNIGMDLCSPEY